MEKLELKDTLKVGDWKELENMKLEDLGTEQVYDGIIVSGYELHDWEHPNGNGELYTRNAFDEFVQDYFVKGGLNMPLTVQHGERLEDIVGKVVSMRVTEDGLHFDCYLPRTLERYDTLKTLLSEGLLSFSKEGYATDYEWVTDEKDAAGGHLLINKMSMTALSLVTTPANCRGLDRVAEIRNRLQFVNETQKQTNIVDELFS